ncbi:hypothetical protein CJF42_13705 [Pseudoalteromonas sp. NBT06-2]|uniref:RodZ domain-containing protein n=1 Tax=Pseudoalteromonas sp. NBT06-2 TaxID=2025950 RepID=UPI000BA6BB73|nr:RodZ domain-containing protein [Pseudoalteromonas sp. NBT06-2]PAJ73844.1 hypothetical protein CJF42_13705 [Pseudoalteromonas sp. NBT06-2]
MTDKTLEQDQEQAKASLGYILIKGREEANISVESLASQLNLDVSQLINLENNQYKNLGPEIFVKGYIKSYCKILNLNECEVMQSYQSVERNSKENQMQSFSNRFEKETHDSRLMLVSYIVLSIVLGSSGILWWQNQVSKEDVAINASEVDMTLNAQTESSDSADTTFVTEPKISSSINQAQSMSSKEEITAINVQNPTSDLKIAKVNTDTVAPEPLKKVILNKIIMHFSGDSWVEIFDATGERVAFGVKKSGYVMTVNGVAPFAVVLGKQQLVEIELDGEKVDTSSLPTNRLAKFQLPLSL